MNRYNKNRRKVEKVREPKIERMRERVRYIESYKEKEHQRSREKEIFREDNA